MIPYVALSSETISFPQEPNTLSLFYEKVINTFKNHHPVSLATIMIHSA